MCVWRKCTEITVVELFGNKAWVYFQPTEKLKLSKFPMFWKLWTSLLLLGNSRRFNSVPLHHLGGKHKAVSFRTLWSMVAVLWKCRPLECFRGGKIERKRIAQMKGFAVPQWKVLPPQMTSYKAKEVDSLRAGFTCSLKWQSPALQKG